MAGVRIRALTTPRQIKFTSTRCRSARQPNPGRRSTYQRADSVQTSGASSLKAGQPVVPVAHPRLGIEVVAISSQDLMVETARLFGFDRTGPDLKEAIDRQTVTLVKSGRLHLDGNVLRLRADGAVP